ncbi:thioesterase domain-containing protein, partial [Burkholderia stagnalis]
GGKTLARGYLGRAGQTAEKFIPDPFREDGSRLYRTGDLCRRREDGTIDFLGRIDQQVKLRGFRIELGEIEAALRQVAGVKQSAVELKGVGEDKRLVGYVSGEVSAAVLRAGLEGKLPGYMVPSAFVVLERLPVMQNGKIDRNALPEPEGLADALRVAPRNATETALLALWQAVLGRDDFGVTNNFFEIGGDSLSALRIAHRAAEAGLSGLTLESLFTQPTIASLAAWLDAHALPPSIVALNSLSASRKLFALHPVFGLVAEYRELAAALDDTVAVYGVQSHHYTDAHWWPETFEAVVDDYVEDIRRVQPEGPYRLLGWSSGAVLAVEIAHRLEALGQAVECLMTIDAGPPDRIVADPADTSRAMERRRARPEELEPLRAFVAQTEKWKGLLPEGEEETLLEQVALVSKYFESLQTARVARELSVPVRHWWGTRTGTPVDAMRDGWRAYVRGERAGDHLVDADHVGILHDAGFIAQVRDLLAGNGTREA